MRSRSAQVLGFVSVAALALGQATAPATRQSTVGKIAATAVDVVPLAKGASVPKLALKTADGKAYDLNAALARQPTVLVFYRGAWCRYCVRQLRGMEGMQKQWREAGYQLLAVSPDKPEEVAKMVEKENFTFTVLSDADATAMRSFGLAFQAESTQFGLLEQYSGADHHALPVPAVYVLGTDGTVKYVHFDADFRVRIDPARVLEQAKANLPR